MKNLKHLLTALVFVSLIIFTNCGGGDGGPKPIDPADEQAKKFTFTWTLEPEGALLGSQSQSEWNGLVITVNGDGDGGTFSTNVNDLTALPSGATAVWPASGNWKFPETTNGSDLNNALRIEDDIEMAISLVTPTQLWLVFTIPASARARVLGLEGEFTFKFGSPS